jgi:hypothetical protein
MHTAFRGRVEAQRLAASYLAISARAEKDSRSCSEHAGLLHTRTHVHHFAGTDNSTSIQKCKLGLPGAETYLASLSVLCRVSNFCDTQSSACQGFDKRSSKFWACRHGGLGYQLVHEILGTPARVFLVAEWKERCSRLRSFLSPPLVGQSCPSSACMCFDTEVDL